MMNRLTETPANLHAMGFSVAPVVYNLVSVVIISAISMGNPVYARSEEQEVASNGGSQRR